MSNTKTVPAVKNSKKTVKTSVTPVATNEVVKKAKETTVWAQKMAKITEEQKKLAEAKREARALEQAAKKRPGVIKTILDIITASKTPVTQAQILVKLQAEFPKREEKSMLNTIKAQIGGKKRPLRMEREKQVIFEIVENKAGVKTYLVAHAELEEVEVKAPATK